MWTWVPFEEDHSKGKDRPVLIVGSDGQYLLALCLTSKAHEGKFAKYYLNIGTGQWDKSARNSYVNLQRVIRIEAKNVRRIGQRIDMTRFEEIKSEYHAVH